MNSIKFAIEKTEEFERWLSHQDDGIKKAADDRFVKITNYGYFGDHRKLITKGNFWELRWQNGLRFYYAYLPKQHILVLLGGTKHGQEKDIKRLQKIYTTFMRT